MLTRDITIPERARRDLGDIAALAASIEAVGMLHPVVVTEQGRLVAGRRRLAAAERLGWPDVPATIATSLDSAASLLVAERDENTCRKDMTITEKIALGRAIEELERPASRDRMVEGGRRGGTEGSGQRTVPLATGETREKVGEALGMSGSTYQRAKAVVIAAETGDSAAEDLREQMDRTGRVSYSYNRLPHIVAARPEAVPKVLAPADGESYNARQIQNAEAVKARVWGALHTLDVLGQELPNLKLHVMQISTTREELVEMVRMLDGATRSLRGFRDQLKTRSETCQP